jgi:hypothetical protein
MVVSTLGGRRGGRADETPRSSGKTLALPAIAGKSRVCPATEREVSFFMFDELFDVFDRDRDHHRPQRRSRLRCLLDRLFGRNHDDDRAYRSRRYDGDRDEDRVHPPYDARRGRRYDDDDDDRYARSGRRQHRSRLDWDD